MVKRLAAFAALLWATAAAAQSPVVEGETIGTPELVKAACAEGAVNYYTGQTAADERRIIAPFLKQFPCIKVSIISEVSGRMYERIRTEVSTGQIQGDVVLLTDPQTTQGMIDAKVVRPWHPPEENVIPDNGKLPGWWYAAIGTPFYPVYNTDAVDAAKAPKTWRDLLAPAYKDKITTASISVGGTGWILYAFLRYQLGEDVLRAFIAQRPRMLTSYTNAALGVARGEFPVGVVASVNDYPARIGQGAPMKPVYPPEGVPFIPFEMMLLTKSPHPNAAELFANWYLSRQGQTSAVKERGAFSWRADVPAPEGEAGPDRKTFWYPGIAFFTQHHDELIDEVNKLAGAQ